ncbi:hypothetical protein [Pseudomonas sp. DP16D-R1]|uniref:hypothetical protein n=1 Tax=Pseudomonas sp. DP16D-R1 TaxID=2075551 RepID=UPI001304A014|nr:hypothetical protein [Pseudomonas sp. DP16D-R1]
MPAKNLYIPPEYIAGVGEVVFFTIFVCWSGCRFYFYVWGNTGDSSLAGTAGYGKSLSV